MLIFRQGGSAGHRLPLPAGRQARPRHLQHRDPVEARAGSGLRGGEQGPLAGQGDPQKERPQREPARPQELCLKSLIRYFASH